MKVLIEVRKRQAHYEGIVIFPSFLEKEVEGMLIPESKNIGWIIKESKFKGYLELCSSFENNEFASKWVNKISDMICLVQKEETDI